MKHLKQIQWPKVLFILILGLSSYLMMACQQSNGGGATPAPPAPIICPAPQVALNGVCVVAGGGPVNTQMQYYSSKTDPHAPSDTLAPDSAYPDFLQNALGVCERCANSGGEIMQCSSWEDGFNLIRLEFIPGVANQVKVHFYSTPKLSNSYFQYAWSFPTLGDFFLTMFTGAAVPSCNPGQYSPYWYGTFYIDSTNNGSGFVAYGQGPYFSKWNRHAIRIYVDTGKVGDSLFNYRAIAITPDNHTIQLAHGSFQRCLTTNCGVY